MIRIPNFKFQISNLEFQISNWKSQTPLLALLCAAATNAPDQIPPLRAPRGELPPGFWEEYGLLVVVGSVLAATLLAIAAWFLARPKPVAPLAPDVVARQALGPLVRQAEDGAVLSGVSQILRRYLTAAFGLPPEELTCTEFCGALRRCEEAGPELSAAIAEFLRLNDERKFAPGAAQPASGAAEQALNFIEASEQRLARQRPGPGGAERMHDRQP